ncbi:amidase [Erythrobacter sp. QSSC1-22B]|uniref:amidase n=1 Tax=Erythrobacter sp. QSSC1-22B TaxID=1860125 RepID=UPI0009F23D80|nr:amidase [Erythrobacter sp. QSSC1-22B]
MRDMVDLADLKRRNTPFNAFVDFDERAQGGKGSLSDLTMGVKANIMVRGLPWTSGLAAYRDRVADRDAHVVTSLRRDGAAILGALNMEEAALGAKTDNPHYGATQNPHRIGHSPGGSSGGSGASVAAGLCDAALGTDTMGSVRIPAAHCGVYGFKPGTVRVSQDGLDPADPSLDAIGVLARDILTLQRVTRVISDISSMPGSAETAILADHGVPLDPAVERAFARVVDMLPEQCATVRLYLPLSRIRFAGFRQVSQSLYTHLQDVGELSKRLRRLLTFGPDRSVQEVGADRAILGATRDRVSSIVDRHGFLIMPTVPNPPFAHDTREPVEQADFTCLANIAGLPAISVPMGWTDGGLPLGVQVVGRIGAEAELFAFARDLDAKLGAYRAPY